MFMTGYAFNKKVKRILVLRGPDSPGQVRSVRKNPDTPGKSLYSPGFNTAAEKQTTHSFAI
jgi:hypothetical protein